MILRHLRYFAAVVREGSVLRAAAELRVAQPALSRQIRQLEREIGFPLFTRERRGVTLTDAGRAFFDDVQRLMERLRAAVQRARLAHEGRLGNVRIGLTRPALMSAPVGAAIKALRERLPDIDLYLTEIGDRSTRAALLDGKVDLAIGMGDDQDTSIRSETLYVEYLDSAILPAQHPLATRDVIEPAQLRDQRFWAVPYYLKSEPEVFASLEQLGFEWEEVASVETLFNLIAAGRGWSPGIGSLRASFPPTVSVVPVRGLHLPCALTLRSRAADSSAVMNHVRTALLRIVSASTHAEPDVQEGVTETPEVSLARLELRQLRALDAVVEEHSLNAASRRLGLSPSAVSRQLGALERAIGSALLDQTANGIVATAAGEVLRQEASTILALVEHATARAQRTARGLIGRCTIGTPPAELTNGLLVTKLKTLAERHPDIAIELVERTTLGPEDLMEQRFDIGIAGAQVSVDDREVSSILLKDDPIECVLLPATDPLAKRAWVRADDLVGEQFLFPRDASPLMYNTIVHALQALGLQVKMDMSLDGTRILWRMIAAGKGWGVGTRSQRSNPPPEIVAVPLEGLNVPWGLKLLWRTHENDIAVRRVLDVFREAA